MSLLEAGTGSGSSWHGVGNWIHDNTDKFILYSLIIILLCVDLYILNKTTDAHIQFLNGLINMTLGALINQVTGSKSKGVTATATTQDDPRSGETKGTLKVDDNK